MQSEELQTQSEEIQSQNKELQAQSEELREIYSTLQESEERFRTMANAIPQLAWIAQPDGYIYWYNERWYSYTGTTPEQMEGWGWQSVHDPKMLPKVMEQWKASLATKQMFDMEFPLRGAAGTFRQFLTRGYPLKDAAGNVIQWFGTNTDITERKKAEQALVEREINRKVIEVVTSERQRLFDVLDTLPVMICLLTADYHVAFANRSYREHFGASGGNCCYEYRFGFTKPCEFCESYKVLETGQLQHWESIDPNGRIIETYNLPFTDVDDSPMILKMDIDITERKLAQDALQKSERQFHALAEAMPQIVWITRADGWNIYFNQQWVDYTGLTLEESYGHGWNKPFHPDDQKRAWDAWQNAVNNNGSYSLECRLRRGDGIYHWWLIRGVPFFNQDGVIEKWFGTCTDIHEIKQAEEKIRLSNIYNRSLIEASLDPLVTIGHDGKITDANTSTEVITGCLRKELIGTDFARYFTEPEKAKEVYQ
jgi:PAS domain S-box-containing protein